MRMNEITSAVTNPPESPPSTFNDPLHEAYGPGFGEGAVNNTRTEYDKLCIRSSSRPSQPTLHFRLAAAVVINRGRGYILVYVPGAVSVYGRGAELNESTHAGFDAGKIEGRNEFGFA